MPAAMNPPPMPGRRRADASPWVKAVLVDFPNNATHNIAVQCAAQNRGTSAGGW